ncbi:hypothetical protein QJS04_geneDACA016533 [Acorus gramineus]|uniref:BSD domain-containing protein n=1 Tax=Acorus gramineus TaxID=55184 RepID=A0AAV9B7I7_ACOGR|nr:hypothetical protein QJS04_geneDACA016533 [Acorus gramineus]
MDLWSRAKVFAEEAAKRSTEISIEAAKRSQELTRGAARISQDFVSETSKRSKELAVEASKRAEAITSEALKIAGDIPSRIPIPPLPSPSPPAAVEADLVRLGVTDELREFVKGIDLSTFRDFPMEDEPEMSEVPTVSNVRQDLTEWQAKHAMLVLSSVKLKFAPPRVNSWLRHFNIDTTIPETHELSTFGIRYEKQYMEEGMLKSAQRKQEDEVKENSTKGSISKTEVTEKPETKLQNRTSTPSTTEQDLDVFLLGDLGSDDEGPGNDGGDDKGNDDDLDKMLDNSVI